MQGAPFSGPVSIGEINEHTDKMNAFNAQQKAWNEIVPTYNDARGTEQAASDRLKHILGQAQADMNGVISIAGKGAAIALDYANNASKASQKLSDMASRSRATALDALQKMKAAPDGMTAKSFEAAWRSATTDAASATSLSEELGQTPLAKVARPALDWEHGTPLLRDLPIAGTVLSGGMAAASILQGKPPGKVIAKAVTSGAAAWAAAEAVAEITPEGRIGAILSTAAGFGASEGADYLTGQAYDAVVKDANGHYDHLGED